MDRSERVPGYCFTAPDGETISVPAGHVTPASHYVHEPMTREQAEDIAIAFGVVTGSQVPIRIRPVAAGDGAIGFAAEVPLEFIGALSDIRAYLDGKPWM